MIKYGLIKCTYSILKVFGIPFQNQTTNTCLISPFKILNNQWDKKNNCLISNKIGHKKTLSELIALYIKEWIYYGILTV